VLLPLVLILQAHVRKKYLWYLGLMGELPLSNRWSPGQSGALASNIETILGEADSASIVWFFLTSRILPIRIRLPILNSVMVMSLVAEYPAWNMQKQLHSAHREDA